MTFTTMADSSFRFALFGMTSVCEEHIERESAALPPIPASSEELNFIADN